MSGEDGEVVVFIVLVLLLSVAPIIVAARLAEKRGRSVWFGIVLAFVLGWIGVLVVALTKPRAGAPRASATPAAPARQRPCPTCGAPMPAASAHCPSCGTASTPWTSHSGHWWARDADGEWRYLDDSRGTWVSPSDGSTRAATGIEVVPPVAAAGTPARALPDSPYVGIDHVQVAAPAGREFDARRFYNGLLGLTEIDKPPALASRGGCWFQAGAHALHVGVADDFVAAVKAHPALRLRGTRELEELAERLDAAGYDVEWADEAEIPGVRRFHVHDPFGNRVELLA